MAAKLKFCTAGGVCITCDGAYESLREAVKVIEEAQERGDKSFLCCNDGKGVQACMRISDIAVITTASLDVPPEKADEYHQESSKIIWKIEDE